MKYGKIQQGLVLVVDWESMDKRDGVKDVGLTIYSELYINHVVILKSFSKGNGQE